MFIERPCFIFQVLASFHESINDGLKEFNLVEVEIDRLMAWQLGVSLQPVWDKSAEKTMRMGGCDSLHFSDNEEVQEG